MASYERIDFAVPKGVREEAQRGLAWRKEHGRGGTEVGVATARTLVGEQRVTPDKARHIAAYFPRHEVDKQGQGFRPGEPGFPSAGRIAWALWGGDAGRSWAEDLVRRMEAEDDRPAGRRVSLALLSTEAAKPSLRQAIETAAAWDGLAEPLADKTHPVMTMPLTGVYADPIGVGGWIGWIEPDDESWIGFVDIDGCGLLWVGRERTGGVLGKPLRFNRPDLRMDAGCRASLAVVALDGDPPAELRLFRKGLNRTKKGDFYFTELSARSVIEAWKRAGVEIPFDYGHGQILEDNQPENGKAAGWCALEVRDGDLYAVGIRWTAKADREIRAREWRYTSPAFHYDKGTREILAMTNIALTNIPATYDAAPLMAAALNTERDMLEYLKTMLGLPMEATEDQIKASLEALMQKMKAMGAETEGLKAQLAAAVGAHAKERGSVEKLSSEIAQLRADFKASEEKGERAALLDAGIREGKILPAARAYWEKRSPADIREFLSVAPPVVPIAGAQGGGAAGQGQGGAQGQGQGGGGPAPATGIAADVAALSELDRQTAESLGVSLEDFARSKRDLYGSAGAVR